MSNNTLPPRLERLLKLTPEQVERLSEEDLQIRAFASRRKALQATEGRFNRFQVVPVPRTVASLAEKEQRAADAQRRHSIASKVKARRKDNLEASRDNAPEEVGMQQQVGSTSTADNESGDTSCSVPTGSSQEEEFAKWSGYRFPDESFVDFYERLLGLERDEIKKLNRSGRNSRRFAIRYGRVVASRSDAAEQLPSKQPKSMSLKAWRKANARAAMARQMIKLRATGASLSMLLQQKGAELPYDFILSDASTPKLALEQPARAGISTTHAAQIADESPGNEGIARISKARQGHDEVNAASGQKRLLKQSAPVLAGQVCGDGGKATIIHPPSMQILAKSRPKACKPEVINLVEDDSSDCLMVEDDSSDCLMVDDDRDEVMNIDASGGSGIAARIRRLPELSSSSTAVTITEPRLTPDRPCVTCRKNRQTCSFTRQKKRCTLCKLAGRKCVFD